MSTAPADPSLPAAPPPARAPSRPPSRPYVFRGESTSHLQPTIWNFGRLLSRIISVLMFSLRVSGQNNIPTSGGVLMITNHQSFLDPWLIGIAPSRQIHYMARDTLFKRGLLLWLLEVLNSFPIKRGAADLTAIRTAVDRLDKGFLVNIFPEGTRSEDGSIGDIAAGLSLILNRCKTDVAILPTLIDGAYEAWPRSSRFPHPHPIRILHGNPIPASEWRKLPAETLALRIRTELVALQSSINSPHTEKSQQRLTTALANPAPTTTRRRR